MLNNPNEWHNIEREAVEIDENSPVEDSYADLETLSTMPKSQKPKRLLFLILVLLILVGAAAYKKIAENNMAKNNTPKDQNAQLAEYFYDEASKNAPPQTNQVASSNIAPNAASIPQATQTAMPVTTDEPTTIIEVKLNNNLQTKKTNTIANNLKPKEPSLDNHTVTVKIGDLGRENPFKPYNSASGTSNLAYNNVGFDVITPPPMILADPTATKLLETTISGIMYDYKSPSAIINIDGEDQLVRKGDKLAGYSILDITKDKVVLKSGSNIYRASVGQSIPLDAVNVNQVANLKKKFAGSYSSGIKSIEIKPN